VRVCQNESWQTPSGGNFSERLHSWERFLQSRILGLQVFADVNRGFRSAVRMGDFGSLSVTRYDVAPHTMARNSRLANDGDDAFCVTILESGSFIAKRDRHGVRIAAGSAIIMPANAASILQITEPSVLWGIKLVDPYACQQHRLLRQTQFLSVYSGTNIDILTSYCQLIDQMPSGARSEAVAKTITSHLSDLVANSFDQANAS
jgi:hypothetical protein